MENPKSQIPRSKSQGRSKPQVRRRNVFTWGLGFGIWVLGFTAGCASEVAPDAYGNVEATEVVISPEAAGQLTKFSVEEGQVLAAGRRGGRG